MFHDWQACYFFRWLECKLIMYIIRKRNINDISCIVSHWLISSPCINSCIKLCGSLAVSRIKKQGTVIRKVHPGISWVYFALDIKAGFKWTELDPTTHHCAVSLRHTLLALYIHLPTVLHNLKARSETFDFATTMLFLKETYFVRNYFFCKECLQSSLLLSPTRIICKVCLRIDIISEQTRECFNQSVRFFFLISAVRCRTKKWLVTQKGRIHS